MQNVAITRWKIAGLLGLILAAMVVAVSMTAWRPTYEATALLEFPPVRGEVMSESDRGRFLLTNCELMRSPPILEAALKTGIENLHAFQGVANPVAWLRSRLQITPVPGSNLVTVSFQHQDPGAATKIVEVVLAAYAAQMRIDAPKAMSSSLIATLEAEKDRRQRSLKQQQDRALVLSRELEEVPSKEGETELEMLKENIEAERTIADRIQTRIEQIQAEAMDAEGMVVLQKPTEPEFPINSWAPGRVGAIAGIALLSPFVVLGLWNVFLGAVRDVAAAVRVGTRVG